MKKWFFTSNEVLHDLVADRIAKSMDDGYGCNVMARDTLVVIDEYCTANAIESQKPAHTIAMVPCLNYAKGECCECTMGKCGDTACLRPEQHHS